MKIVVIGGSGGIGQALLTELRSRFPDAQLFSTWCSRRSALPGVRWDQLDVCDETAIAQYAAGFDTVHWLINTVGVLHTPAKGPEKTIRHVDSDFFIQSMRSNTLPTLLLAKHFMPTLRHGETARFASVSARVGSIGDNRLGGWYSYRCSKAALNMAVKSISVEWARSLPNVVVSALHPGTTETALSQPFQAGVADDKLFSPEKTAQLLVECLSRLERSDSGKFLAYDGSEIPW